MERSWSISNSGPVRGFKKGSRPQVAGPREQLLADPMAHLGAQAVAGEVLAVRSPHHASIGTNFFHPFRAHLISQFDHLIGDAVGLELASKGVHVSKLTVVGNPTRDCRHIRHPWFGADRAEVLILDQPAADHLSDLFCVFGRPLGCGLLILSESFVSY